MNLVGTYYKSGEFGLLESLDSEDTDWMVRTVKVRIERQSRATAKAKAKATRRRDTQAQAQAQQAQ